MSSPAVDTRTRILQAAWELLESRRGSGVRMTDIARRAGISRQAVYLHFKSRAELLIATTRYVDEVKAIDERLQESRSADTGAARLVAFIDAWGNYIPEIYGIGRALMSMKDTDAEAKLAWDDRMQAVRHGCAAAITALDRDGRLHGDYPVEEATDVLWTLLSVRNWEQLTIECNWSQDKYIELTTKTAQRILLSETR